MRFILMFVISLIAVSSVHMVDEGSFKLCRNRRFDVHVVTTLKLRSKIRCASACFNKHWCRSANYFNIDNTCELLQENHIGRDCDYFTLTDGVTLLKMTRSTQNGELSNPTENITSAGNDESSSTERMTSDANGESQKPTESMTSDVNDESSSPAITTSSTENTEPTSSAEMTSTAQNGQPSSTTESMTSDANGESQRPTESMTSDVNDELSSPAITISSTGNTESTSLAESISTAENGQPSSTTESGNPCKNNQEFDGENCKCEAALTGQYCEIGQRDCAGITTNGWFDVYPEDGLGAIKVYCWNDYLYIFAAPENGLTSNYFNRSWLGYKVGFGDIQVDAISAAIGGYWLGNDKIHRITRSTGAYKLRYYPNGPGLASGDYEHFRIDEENKNYTAHYSSFIAGNRGIDQTLQTGCPFRTFDKNDNGCASVMKVGFWFDDACTVAPPLFGTVSSGGVEKQYTNFWASLISM